MNFSNEYLDFNFAIKDKTKDTAFNAFLILLSLAHGASVVFDSTLTPEEKQEKLGAATEEWQQYLRKTL